MGTGTSLELTTSLAAKCKTSKGQAIILAGVLSEIALLVYALVWNPDTTASREALISAVDILLLPTLGLMTWLVVSLHTGDPIANTGKILGILAIVCLLGIILLAEYAWVNSKLVEDDIRGTYSLTGNTLPKLFTSLLIVMVVTGLAAFGIAMRNLS